MFKNRIWVFRGETYNLSRYTNKKIGKTIYLVDPTNSVNTLSAYDYQIPKSMKSIHGFHPDYMKLELFNYKVSIKAIPFSGTLKEKLFKKQKGLCFICNKTLMNPETLEIFTNLNIHHIDPISQKGSKSNRKNLILVHNWCHLKHHYKT